LSTEEAEAVEATGALITTPTEMLETPEATIACDNLLIEINNLREEMELIKTLYSGTNPATGRPLYESVERYADLLIEINMKENEYNENECDSE
jgi:hypothetical protein